MARAFRGGSGGKRLIGVPDICRESKPIDASECHGLPICTCTCHPFQTTGTTSSLCMQARSRSMDSQGIAGCPRPPLCLCLPKSRGSKFQRPLKQGINLWSCVAACAALLHLRSFAFFGASRRMSAAEASLHLAGGDLQPSQSESCVQERFFPWVKASLSQRLCEPSARWGVRVWPGVGHFLCSLRLALIFLSRFKGWPLSSCDFAHSQIHTQWKLHTRSATKKP